MIHSFRIVAKSNVSMQRVATTFGILFFLTLSSNGWADSKVFLRDGQTRLGYVHVRDGRVTVRASDRLYQHPERAVHRIEHITGTSALIAQDNVSLREKPERLSRTGGLVPKGCEVRILGRQGEWVQVEAYLGRALAAGFIHQDDLSDTVLLNPPESAIVQFKDPPPSIADKYPSPAQISSATEGGLPGGMTYRDYEMLSEQFFGAVERVFGNKPTPVDPNQTTTLPNDENNVSGSVGSATP